jgi:hypothetical protein
VAVSLLARFPKLRAPSVSWPVIPDEKRASYPNLNADFTILDDEVKSAFTDYDLAALRDQNRYRRQQVLILLGAALVAGLGGLQAVFPAERWPGVLMAVLAAALAATTLFAKESESQAEYLDARVKAERLRALYFLYLSASGPYAGPDRTSNLRRAVVAIKRGEEP